MPRVPKRPRATPAQSPKPRKARPATGAAKLDELSQLLAEAIRNAPRAADFEGLAEHLYAFAASAPKLAERLDASAAALAEQVAGLAKVAPAVVELIGEAMRVAASLTSATAGLERSAARFDAAATDAAVIRSAPAASGRELSEALARIDRALSDLVEALEMLPRAADYEPFAKQLREIASVSPSLLEWLGEVPRIATPLKESVERLWGAVVALREARAILDACITAAGRGPGTQTRLPD